MLLCLLFNTLRPRQNGCHFADDHFKCIFLDENVGISITISLKFVPKGQTNNIPALVQIMAWRRPGDKPLSEPMKVSLLTDICVTRPQWVNCVHKSYCVVDHGWLVPLTHLSRQNGHDFVDNILIRISLKFVPKCLINNNPMLLNGGRWVNTYSLWQNGYHFADSTIKFIFLHAHCCIVIEISLKFLARVKVTMIQHWFRQWLDASQATSHYLKQWWPSLLTQICITWPQWVKVMRSRPASVSQVTVDGQRLLIVDMFPFRRSPGWIDPLMIVWRGIDR